MFRTSIMRYLRNQRVGKSPDKPLVSTKRELTKAKSSSNRLAPTSLVLAACSMLGTSTSRLARCAFTLSSTRPSLPPESSLTWRKDQSAGSLNNYWRHCKHLTETSDQYRKHGEENRFTAAFASVCQRLPVHRRITRTADRQTPRLEVWSS